MSEEDNKVGAVCSVETAWKNDDWGKFHKHRESLVRPLHSKLPMQA